MCVFVAGNGDTKKRVANRLIGIVVTCQNRRVTHSSASTTSSSSSSGDGGSGDGRSGAGEAPVAPVTAAPVTAASVAPAAASVTVATDRGRGRGGWGGFDSIEAALYCAYSSGNDNNWCRSMGPLWPLLNSSQCAYVCVCVFVCNYATGLDMV